MNLFELPSSPKVHIRTHTVNGAHVLVTGELKEQRLVTVYDDHTGEEVNPGIYHHMRIGLLIEILTFKVARLDAQMLQVPYEICRKLEHSLDEVQGLQIAPGFTSQVRRIAGGAKVCVHLTNLLLAMTPAVIQGYWTDQTKVPANEPRETIDMSQYLIDTCWAWRRQGALAEAYSATRKKPAE